MPGPRIEDDEEYFRDDWAPYWENERYGDWDDPEVEELEEEED